MSTITVKFQIPFWGRIFSSPPLLFLGEFFSFSPYYIRRVRTVGPDAIFAKLLFCVFGIDKAWKVLWHPNFEENVKNVPSIGIFVTSFKTTFAKNLVQIIRSAYVTLRLSIAPAPRKSEYQPPKHTHYMPNCLKNLNLDSKMPNFDSQLPKMAIYWKLLMTKTLPNFKLTNGHRQFKTPQWDHFHCLFQAILMSFQ